MSLKDFLLEFLGTNPNSVRKEYVAKSCTAFLYSPVGLNLSLDTNLVKVLTSVILFFTTGGETEI